MADIVFDPELMLLIKTIYGDKELNGKLLKQIHNTWKVNPDWIRNAASLKPRISLEKLDATTPSSYLRNLFLSTAPSRPVTTQSAPTLPVTKPFATKYWLNRANQATNNAFKSIDDVRKWLADNGLTVDGKFGNNSLNKWLELVRESITGGGKTLELSELENDVTSERSSKSNAPTDSPYFMPSNYANGEKAETSKDSNFPRFKGKGSYWNTNTLTSSIKRQWWKYLLSLGNKAQPYDENLYKTDDYKRFESDAFNLYEDFRKETNNYEGIFKDRYTLKKFQQGGIMNKYQQGGPVNGSQQEELQKAFMAFLIQDAAAQGIQIQSEQDLQTYAELLGEEGIQAKYQEFIQKMQGGTMARLGAKLEYYRKLKGVCPDGSQPTYFKEGGFFKKGCSCLSKAKKGTKVNEVQKFKNKREAEKIGAKMKKK